MAKETIIKFEEKTEVKGVREKFETSTCYYTTADDMFVPGSLSLEYETAYAFYKMYLERGGKLTETKVLETQTITTA